MHAIGRRLISLLGSAILVPLLASAALAANPVPLINQPLVPAATVPGGPAFTLTVNGTGFVSGAVVNWNGSARATTFVSSMQLTASILASDIATAGTASVTVVNPAPGGGVSNVVFLPITNPTSSAGFNLTSSLATGMGPVAVAVGDFNGDGKQDLAVANSGSDTVSIFLGDGMGNFTLASSPATGEAVALAVGDFNSDGKLDLAVATTSQTIAILLGDGTGNFTLAFSVALAANPISLAVGDFNEDGNLDLAVNDFVVGEINPSYMTCIFLGNGTGNFSQATTISAGADPVSTAVGDFNQDGHLDLAIANYCGPDDSCMPGGELGTVSILLGDGTGNFSLAASPTVGLNPSSVVAADFNGDGNLDLAVANQCGSDPLVCTVMGNGFTLSILLGDGTGNFTLFSSPVVGSEPQSLALGDFNGDGKLDLAVANESSNTVSLLLGDGSGNFSVVSTAATGDDPVSVAAGDFTGNGRLGLATANQGGNTVSILLQAPAVMLSSASLMFGSQYVGSTSAPMSSTLTNTGSFALDISSISITGANTSDFSETNNCGATVAVGASCAISVTFTPADSGSLSATLNIFDNASGSPQMIALAGTGTDTAFSAPVLSPTSLILMPGQSGTFTATVTPAVGVGGITFTCVGAPPGATCTPGTPVTNANGTVSSTVKITTTAASLAPLTRINPPSGPTPLTNLPGGLLWLAALTGSLGAFLLGTRLRPQWNLSRRSGCAALVLLIMSLGFLTACGSGSGGSSGGGGQTGTPEGTYALVVTATGSGQSASSTFTLSVN